MTIHTLMDAYDADGRFAILLTCAGLAIAVTLFKVLQLAWYALEPVVYALVEEIQDVWSDRAERRRVRAIDRARDRQRAAAAGRAAGRDHGRVLRARFSARVAESGRDPQEAA